MFLQLILVLVVLIPLLAIVLDSQVGRALASRLERRGLDAPADITAERLAFLETEVERLSSEVMRLDEEGQFLQKLLTERVESAGGELPPGDEPD
jgi:ribose 1,5-bisphosphokinase PhnN